jgi:hypothetical protein
MKKNLFHVSPLLPPGVYVEQHELKGGRFVEGNRKSREILHLAA